MDRRRRLCRHRAELVTLHPDTPLTGLAGLAGVLRSAAWCGLLLALYHRTTGPRGAKLLRRFLVASGVVTLLALLARLRSAGDRLALTSLGSPTLLAGLCLSLIIVLLAENLFRNASEAGRWHVNLPSIAPGGLAAFDVLL